MDLAHQQVGLGFVLVVLLDLDFGPGLDKMTVGCNGHRDRFGIGDHRHGARLHPYLHSFVARMG